MLYLSFVRRLVKRGCLTHVRIYYAKAKLSMRYCASRLCYGHCGMSMLVISNLGASDEGHDYELTHPIDNDHAGCIVQLLNVCPPCLLMIGRQALWNPRAASGLFVRIELMTLAFVTCHHEQS
jgi:hypothetical protein